MIPQAAGARLEPSRLSDLGAYLAYLLAMNEKLNLTAVREPVQAWQRHIFDALTLLPWLDEVSPNARVVDVGSGGGVPGFWPAHRANSLDGTFH